MPAEFLKILVLLVVVVAIYLFLEEQLDVTLHAAKSKKGGGDPGRSKFLQSLTGASFEDQLIEALLMISSSLKAGRNLDQAFELVAISTPPPLCNEFRTLVQNRRSGVPMTEALGNLARRVPSIELRLAVNATIFQQETGGNLEDLYRQIVVTVSERKKIMGKVIAGTAHARLSGNTVGAIPVVLALGISIYHPSYLSPMLRNPIGQLILIGSLMSSALGLLFINRMTTGILPDPEEAITNVGGNTKSKGIFALLLSGILSFIALLFRPLLRVLAEINARLRGGLIEKYREEMRFLLQAAGSPGELTPDEFIAIKEISALMFVLAVLIFFNPIKLGVLGVILLIVVFPIGFHVPRIYLSHLIRRRQFNIEYELPYTIDLLSLAIEAGLDLVGGIQKIVEKSRPTDIIIEFRTFMQDVKVGKSLEEALSDMAERVQVLSFFSFISSLIQAQRLGAEIGPTLRAQAEQMRYQRMILAEERVNQLPVKLLIPLVIFVFPSIFVWLIGPSLMQVWGQFPEGIPR